MQAVVLAAGEGTRLRPLTETRPKGLVEVAGKPILTHCFEDLAALGVEGIVVVVGYRAEDVVEHYGEAVEGVPLAYAHQDDRLGLAHALLAAREHVSGPFVQMHGDYLVGDRRDLERVLERHRRGDAAATLLVDEVAPEAATGYGVCEFDDDGALIGLTEKPRDPASNVVVTGFFGFDPVVFPACELVTPSGRGEYELTAAIDLLVRAGHDVALVPAEGWLANVNTHEDREEAERRLA